MSRSRDAASALLPPGAAWTRARDSNLGRLLDAITGELARLEKRSADFDDELTPDRATELLTRWEQVLAVPAACRVAATLEARRAAASARLLPPEDASLAALGAAIVELGYPDATFVEHGLFRADQSAAGDAVRDDAWVHVLDVETPRGPADDALRCLLADRVQAHVLARLRWQEAAA